MDGSSLRTLVTLLEFMPLALELAAAQLEHRSLQELINDLSSDSARSLYQVLEASIERSWTLLSRASQQALAQSAVFSGGFSVEAFEAIIDLEDTPERSLAVIALEDLCEHSLIRSWSDATGGIRFGLYEAIRSFAASRLDPSRRRSSEDRHARYYVRLGERAADGLVSPDFLRSMQQLDQESANLFAVSQRTHERTPELAARAMISVGKRLLHVQPQGLIRPLTSLLDLTLHPERLGQITLLRGQCQLQLGHLVAALEDLTAALQIADTRQDTRLAIEAGMEIANAHRLRGQIPEATALIASVLEQARALGEASLLGRTLIIASGIDTVTGRPRMLERTARAALEAFEATGALKGIASAKMWLAQGLRMQGRFDEALPLFEETVEIFRELSVPIEEVKAHSMLAGALFNAGKLARSQETYVKAERLNLRLGNTPGAVQCRQMLAVLALEQGDLRGAEAHFKRVIKFYQRRGNESRAILAWGGLGYIAHLTGRFEDARHAYGRAEEELRACGDQWILSGLLVHRGALSADVGDVHAAEQSMQAALDLGEKALTPDIRDIVTLTRGHVCLAQARLAQREGRSEAAQELVDAARACLARYADRTSEGFRLARMRLLVLLGCPLDRPYGRPA